MCMHACVCMHKEYMSTTSKNCNSCNCIKPISNFHKNGSRGRHNICSLCRNNKRKSWSKEWEKRADRIYKSYMRSAAKRGLDFKLDISDFYSKNLSCNYCGTTLDKVRFDRVDNEIGYCKENIVPCCHLCNFLKQDLTKDIFLDQVSKIFSYQKGKDNDK